MRILAFAFALPLLVVAALVLPAAAGAQQVKQVEVTNPSVRFQLVGFTTNQNYNGNLGGWFGATEKCQMDFPGARMCTFDEVRNTTVIPALPALPAGTEAWAGSTCGEWTVGLRGSGSTQAVVNSDTGNQFGEFCDELHPIACCALVP